MRAKRPATQNFGDTLYTLVLLTARHCLIGFISIPHESHFLNKIRGGTLYIDCETEALL